jgi:hypothetical protein
MHIQSLLQLLESEIEELKKKYDLFFQGILRVEPMKERNLLEQQIRRIGQRSIPITTDKFKFETLRSRFYSYNTMWARVITMIEEGRMHRDSRGKVSFDSSGPIDEDNLNKTFLDYLNAKKELEEEYDRVEFSSFKEKLLDKAHEIQKKSGCQKVEFQVVIEDGKTKLKAVKK